MTWIWDPTNHEEHFEKHKITFQNAASMLNNPLTLIRVSTHTPELRHIAIGTIGNKIRRHHPHKNLKRLN